jgi:aromatic ring hydroxylase
MDRIEKIDDLLKRAQEAREIAEVADTPEFRAAMQKLAETYEEIAKRAQDELKARCKCAG